DLLVTRPLVETDPEPLQVAIEAGAIALVTPTLTSLDTDIPCIRVDEQSAATLDEPGGQAVGGAPVSSATAGESGPATGPGRSDEHTSELQSRVDVVCRLLLEQLKVPDASHGP